MRITTMSMMIVVTTLSFAIADDDAAEAGTSKLLKTFVAEFIEITPGKGKFPQSFEMGSDADKSEQPAHKVTLNNDFAIAKYEVPQNLYEAVMGRNPSKWQGPRNSVEMMTWNEANEFCRKITALLQDAKLIGEDEVVRLPTEAEWEYCCRAGTKTAFSFGPSATKPGDEGKTASILNEYGWHTGNAAGNDPPVGALKPNPWGLYDVHGYLWEFVADTWHDNYNGAPADGTARSVPAETNVEHVVVRGGSWRDAYERHRSAARRKTAVDEKSDAIGFRCVKAKQR